MSSPARSRSGRPRANVLEFGLWVKAHRQSMGLSRARAAKQCGFDPSLWTLIERDGHVPNEEKVREIGELFGDPDMALLMARIVPEKFVTIFVDMLTEKRNALQKAIKRARGGPVPVKLTAYA